MHLLASTTAWGLLTLKPLGTAFSSAYFLSNLNFNRNLQMDNITCICLLTFITICWFSCKAAAGQQAGKLPFCCGLDAYFGPGETSATGTGYPTASEPTQQGEACSNGECPFLDHLPAVQGEIPEKSRSNVCTAEVTVLIPVDEEGKLSNFGYYWKLLDGLKTGEKELSFR